MPVKLPVSAEAPAANWLISGSAQTACFAKHLHPEPLQLLSEMPGHGFFLQKLYVLDIHHFTEVPEYLGVVPASWNKGFQWAIKCVCHLLGSP